MDINFSPNNRTPAAKPKTAAITTATAQREILRLEALLLEANETIHCFEGDLRREMKASAHLRAELESVKADAQRQLERIDNISRQFSAYLKSMKDADMPI